MGTKIELFERDLAEVFKKHGMDRLTHIPDYALAKYTIVQLGALKEAHLEALIQSHKGVKQL